MMSIKQLEKRRKIVLEGVLIGKTHTFCIPNYLLHHKSYLQGYIRCINCKKWIHPDKPEESKEIEFAGGGKRHHKDQYCPVNSTDPSVFATVPRFHGSRRKRLDQIKRY